jgi:hypothetical protein
MYIVETIDNFNINNIYFTPSLENTVMDEGTFSKILYSSPDIIMNGLYILCSFSNTSVEKIAHNKFKIAWNKEKNIDLIDSIKKIEKNIMNKNGTTNAVYQLEKFLDYNNIRIFSDEKKLVSNNDFILRISGIWENNSNCGITYKFLELNNF